MLKEREALLRRFLIFVDTCVLVLAYLFAFLLHDLLAEAPLPLLKFWLALVFAIPYWCLALYANGLYQSMRTRT